jgi:hypothetical protein
MPPRTQKLINELKDWCDSEYGLRSNVAREIGIAPQALWNWFAGVQQPTAEQILHVQELLKNRKLGGVSTRKPKK